MVNVGYTIIIGSYTSFKSFKSTKLTLNTLTLFLVVARGRVVHEAERMSLTKLLPKVGGKQSYKGREDSYNVMGYMHMRAYTLYEVGFVLVLINLLFFNILLPQVILFLLLL